MSMKKILRKYLAESLGEVSDENSIDNQLDRLFSGEVKGSYKNFIFIEKTKGWENEEADGLASLHQSKAA
ncbi:MAG: hypothetical protein K6G26_07015 [Lachnospiraceae bacterium]|nr:hypothetical protein [Lachnospiraceae bacterium]